MTSSVAVVGFFVLCASGVFGEFPTKFTLNSGYDIPAIGLGTYLIHGSPKTNEVVDAALAAGYRLFDSAHLYSNEADLGAAFEELLPKHNLTRADIFITTKFFPSSEEKTEADYEKLVRKSLANFRTDYIDLYLIHWPGVSGIDPQSPDVISHRHTAWQSLIKFHKAGLIRSIGVSNFVVKHLEDLKKEFNVVPALNQIEWHPRSYDNKILDYCRENGIVLQAYSSLGSSEDPSLRNDPVVIKIAEEIGKTPAQVLLRWALQRNIAIIPKATSKKHLEENLKLDFDIPEDKMAILDSQPQRDRKDWNPNTII